MWKRERMMVDVISLQTTTATTTTTTTTKNNDLQDKAPLQNRQYYPIGGGMIHDDANNFYAGNEYDKKKAKTRKYTALPNISTITIKDLLRIYFKTLRCNGQSNALLLNCIFPNCYTFVI
jgi:hypothetical protein